MTLSITNKPTFNLPESDEKESEESTNPLYSKSKTTNCLLRLIYTKLKAFPSSLHIEHSKKLIEWGVRRGISMMDKDPAIHLQVLRIVSLGKKLWNLQKKDFPLRGPEATPLLIISTKNEKYFLKVKKELDKWSTDHPIREDEEIDMGTQIGQNAYMLDLLMKEIDVDKLPEGKELITAWDEMGNLQGVALFSKERSELNFILKGFWNCTDFIGQYPRLKVKGVGSALIEQTIFTSLKLTPELLGAFRLQANDEALPFYRKLGFEKAGLWLQLPFSKISAFLNGKYSGRAVFQI
ncbi:MAG: GNAT family N-acetyltransferase [Parachlamydiales bacterium]|nr:GNAT family N-acetyltransferase [Parachlamydiales bacterium]